MLRFFIVLGVLSPLLGCNNSIGTGQIWRASDENGDKPGIGYELRIEDGKVTGTAYILDPDYPHNFSHGRRAAMTIVEQSAKEITFRVKWDQDLKATLRFQFKDAVWPDSFQAVVAEMDGSEPVDSESYTFAKVN